MKIILLADNNEKRENGLMFHRPLNEDECALFNFNHPGKYCFWNKNVSFPISLIFCNANKEIVDIKKLDAQQKEAVYPDSNEVFHVVEAHIDAPKKYNLDIGKKINIKNSEIFYD